VGLGVGAGVGFDCAGLLVAGLVAGEGETGLLCAQQLPSRQGKSTDKQRSRFRANILIFVFIDFLLERSSCSPYCHYPGGAFAALPADQ
jgi:hypothetical protein